MSPSEVLNKHTSREMTEWMIYLSLEPSGEERADLRAGIVACTIANSVRGKGTKPTKPQDFMPKFDNRVEEQTEEEIMFAAQSMAIAFGGKAGKVSKS